MQVARARYRSKSRQKRFETLKDHTGTVAKMFGCLALMAWFFGFCVWVGSTANHRQVKPVVEGLSTEQLAQEQFIIQSTEAGATWAKDFSATHQDCDSRIGTKALELEGFDQKAWLEGCLTTAKTLTLPEG